MPRFYLLFTTMLTCGLLGSLIVHAQTTQKAHRQPLQVPGKSFLMVGDSSIYVERDTTIYLPDSLYSKYAVDSLKKDDAFYKKIKGKYGSGKFSKQLYEMLFQETGQHVQRKITQNYNQYVGKRIDSVRIVGLMPLGTNLDDTTQMINLWAIRFANRFHVLTRQNVVRNNLLFAVDDKVVPYKIADSERLLRGLSFIEDARIYLQNNPSSKDGVIAVVVVKDIWSLVPRLDYNGLDHFALGLADINFLGLGHEIGIYVPYNNRYRPMAGFSATYGVQNIRRTFTSLGANFTTTALQNSFSFQLQKQFLTPDTKYGGALSLTWNKEDRVLPVSYDQLDTVHLNYNHQDFWLGRAFQLPVKGNFRRNIGFAGRYFHYHYFERPTVTADSNRQYSNQQDFLFSLSLTGLRYTKDRYVVGYGRTEDIPTGFSYSLLWGKDYNEFNVRDYIGFKASAGDYLDKMGYGRIDLDLGAFRHDGHWEQGCLRLGLNYFSNLYVFKDVRFRQIIKAVFVKGFDRFDDDFLNFNEIRGFSDTLVRGDSKLALSAESLFFAPFNVLGFNFTFFGFADLGLIAKSPEDLFGSKLYQVYGVGVRIRNEHLAIRTFQIRLGVYPVHSRFQDAFEFEVSAYDEFEVGDFNIRKPEVVPLR